MKNALFSGISGGETKKDSDSDEEQKAPAEPEINLLDFDAGASASTTGDLLGSSTTGDLLGTSDPQASTQPASSGGLLDFGSTPQPTENVLGSFGISTQ